MTQRPQPRRYHFLAAGVVLITAISLFLLARAIAHIEATLPETVLHQERDFSAFLLDVQRLEAALRSAVATPSPAQIEHLVFSLDLAVLRMRDNQSLYRDSGIASVGKLHADLAPALRELEDRLHLGTAAVDALRASLARIETQRLALQRLNDALFQHSMNLASAQKKHLEHLRIALSLLLIIFSGFSLALLFLARRQWRSIQILDAHEAQLRASEAGYRAVEAELRRSNDELEQFAYAISHDMRQPLRMITSYLQLLEKDLRETLSSDSREYLNFARDGAKRLDQMLVGLLEYSRVGRKTEAIARISSREALEEAMLFLKPLIEETRADIRVRGDWPQLPASHDELVRLFQNLIGNALKYRAGEHAPNIEIVGSLDAHAWTVRIRDDGIGIVPGQIPRLFQVFQRLQARSRYEGAGVGLALCRKIVEHHGGHIHAESAGEGQGSTFIFELPIAAQSAT